MWVAESKLKLCLGLGWSAIGRAQTPIAGDSPAEARAASYLSCSMPGPWGKCR